MKNRLLVVCIFASVIITAGAQAAAPEVPSGPLVITKMPDRAQWTVDYTYTDALKPGTESPQLAYFRQQAKIDPLVAKQMENPAFVAALSPSRPIHALITKTGTIWHIEVNMEDGQRSEEWRSAQVTAIRKPGMSKFNVVLDDNAGRVDFPEFYWIAAANYVGPGSDSGQKTLVFKANVNPTMIHYPGLEGNGETVPGEAHIDWSTRYPVYLQFGDETRKYTYMAAPTDTLVLPDEISAVWKTAQKQLERLTPTPSNR